MAFTTITITVLACMLSMIIAIVIGNYIARNPNVSMLSLILGSLIVVPIATIILLSPIYNLVTFYDWPNIVFVLPPQVAIFVAAAFGGVLGFKSGMIWNQGEASCFYCLFSVVSILAGLSLVVVLFL
ncbi:MAG: hypothetical protein ACFFF9_11680 [Candidatus Thorarchaeota archaeon]